MPNVGVCRARLRDIILLLLLLSARRLLYTTVLILLYTSTRRRSHTHVFKTFTTFSTHGYIQYMIQAAVTCDTLTRFATLSPFLLLVYIILYYTHIHTHTHTHARAHESALSIIRTNKIGTYIPIIKYLYLSLCINVAIIMGRRAASHCGDVILTRPPKDIL